MRARLRACWLLLNACSAPAPIAPPPLVPAVTLPIRAEISPPALSVEPSERAIADVSEPAVSQPLRPAPPEPVVMLEPAYSALGHPALATEMQTLERDDELFQWALGGNSDPGHPANQPGYHPATRVVVDIELLSRVPKETSTRLLRIARSSGYWPLRACFEDSQRQSARAERAARVRLTLNAFGKVLGARNLGKSGDAAYSRCVLSRLRRLNFSPGFARKLDVEISVKQWPGHAPVPPHAPEGTPPLRLSPEAAASFAALRPELAACYERGLAMDARLWGRIALRLSLGEDGSIHHSAPVETHFPNAEVVECARQAVLGARLGSSEVTELTVAFRLGQPPAPPAPPSLAGAPPSEGAPPAPAPPAPPAPMH